MTKIAIIGAGPAGLYSAHLLASKGHDVNIYEEHSKIGLPIQCTGILTAEIANIIPLSKEFLINKITKIEIVSQNNKLDFNLQKPNYIVCRHKFDSHIAELAKKSGAKLHPNHRYLSNTKNTVKIKNTETQETRDMEFDFLIGADGANSLVAKNNGLWQNREFWFGVQAVAKMKNDNSVKVFPDIGTFAWIVPEDSETVRIGLIADKNPKQIFDKFITEQGIGQILQMQGGPIPKYKKISTQKDNIFLIGDSALMIKNTSAGGVVQNLMAAKCLAQAIDEKKEYGKIWRSTLTKDLWAHKKIRNILDKFNSTDTDYLIRLINKPKIKYIIENSDREYPTRFLFKLFFAQPKLIYFAKYLF